jgi:DNA-directed RNA polymerase subunit RPC12/RpoP
MTDEGTPNIQHQHDGQVRTSMNCHACSKVFLALIDHSVDGSIVIVCPHCGHKHHRVIDKGIVTDERDGSDTNEQFVAKVTTWKHPTLPAKATTTSEFLRHRWLNLHQSGR